MALYLANYFIETLSAKQAAVPHHFRKEVRPFGATSGDARWLFISLQVHVIFTYQKWCNCHLFRYSKCAIDVFII